MSPAPRIASSLLVAFATWTAAPFLAAQETDQTPQTQQTPETKPAQETKPAETKPAAEKEAAPEPEAKAEPVVALPEFELGYRFVDVTGNEDEYRSQINDRPGVLLRSLSWASSAPVDGVLDYFRVDASDLGAGPAGSFRLSAGQLNLFKLDFTWRTVDYFSALPAFANPFIDDGIVPGQQTYNRTRQIYDVNVQILPGKKLTPILGYTQNIYRGPGTSTYHLGSDEFLLNQNINSRDEEFRVGLGFDFGMVQGAIVQGWRKYRSAETVSLAPGAGDGNVSVPVLGQDEHADGIARTTNNSTNTPVTSIWVTAKPISRLRLVGSYVRSDADGDTGSGETDAGTFVSFEISRFFQGLTDTINSHAETDYWRGSARAEFSILSNVTLSAGWTERSRDLTGSALATSLFIDTMTFGGVSTGDIRQIALSNTSLERDDRVFDATVTATQLGPVSVNAGWSQLHQDVTFGSELSSVVIPGEAPGDYTRTVNTFGGGASFAKGGFMLSGDYRHDDGNQPIMRTDFTSRDRYKVRAGYTFKNFLKIGGSWRESHASDDAPEILQSTVLREVLADAEVTLLKGMLTLRASGGEFKANRSILIREPQDFDIVPTFQREMGHTWEGGVTFAWKALTLNGNYMWMGNDGSIPFTINRIRALAEYFVTPRWGLEFEWLWDKYGESPAFDQAGPLANYNADRYGIFVHWKP